MTRFWKDSAGELSVMSLLTFVVFLAILAGTMPTIQGLIGNLTVSVGPVETSLANLYPLALIVSAFGILLARSQ